MIEDHSVKSKFYALEKEKCMLPFVRVLKCNNPSTYDTRA